VHVCHHCTRPTFHDEGSQQFPGVAYGEPAKGIGDDSVEKLDEEARRAMSVNRFTAVVLSCRGLLMHLAVSRGAAPGESFVNYVQFLADNHYMSPDAKDWVGHIRLQGNEANHVINTMTRDDTELLVSFIQILLKVIYEFPSAIKDRIASAKGTA
jgi:hypothetical protein